MTAIMIASGSNPFHPAAWVGGAETSLKQIAQGLSKLGHNVVYLTMSGTEQPSSRDSRRENGLINLPKKLSPLSRGLSLVLVFPEAVWLVARHNVKTLYCYYDFFGFALIWLLGGLFPSLRVTLRIAGLSWPRNTGPAPWRLWLYRAAFKRVDLLNYIHQDLIGPTQKMASNLGIDLSAKAYFVGDIGVPLETLPRPSSRRNRASDTPEPMKILIPTRLSNYQKRQDLIIDAIPFLPAEVRVHLSFVGEGERRSLLEELASSKLDPVDFDFLGYLPQSKLWEKIAQSDLVALPTDYEGLSKVIIESMAIGTPVLVSNVTPLKTYIRHGKNGFVAANSPVGWATGIAHAHGAREHFPKVAANAREFVENSYSAQANIRLFERYLT